MLEVNSVTCPIGSGAQETPGGDYEQPEWWRSILLIAALLAAVILVAQSRRNCEIPGSSYVPCIWGKPLKTP